MRFFGEIKNNKIKWDNKVLLIDHIQSLPDRMRIVIDINEAKDIRTNNQNKLWWKWVEIISNYTGDTKQSTHSILKYKFLLKDEVIDGEVHQYLKSTATLSKKEFRDLLDNVHYFASDTLGINLPSND